MRRTYTPGWREYVEVPNFDKTGDEGLTQQMFNMKDLESGE
jgi:hypothetical protein